MYVDETQFRTLLIEYLRNDQLFPEPLPIVARYQNESQPVNIFEGESMMDIWISNVEKVGTDYIYKYDDGNGNTLWRGDRLVSVEMEYFGSGALSQLTKLRDLAETQELIEFTRDRGFVEERPDGEPLATTRLHGNTKFIESAEYVVKFATYVEYSDVQGAIESGNIGGTVDTKTQEVLLDIPYTGNP